MIRPVPKWPKLFWTFYHHISAAAFCCILLLSLFRSTTITETLSVLVRRAFSMTPSATYCAGLTDPLAAVANCLRSSLSILRAIPITSSLDMTSHKPSLARIKHSSLSVRVEKVTSGYEISHGFRSWSPKSGTYMCMLLGL